MAHCLSAATGGGPGERFWGDPAVMERLRGFFGKGQWEAGGCIPMSSQHHQRWVPSLCSRCWEDACPIWCKSPQPAKLMQTACSLPSSFGCVGIRTRRRRHRNGGRETGSETLATSATVVTSLLKKLQDREVSCAHPAVPWGVEGSPPPSTQASCLLAPLPCCWCPVSCCWADAAAPPPFTQQLSLELPKPPSLS